jgi:hypothetical protein
VVSSAGTTYRATIAEMVRCIRDAVYQVRRRRQDYSYLEEPAGAAA